MTEKTKRVDKMWETGNSNTYSSVNSESIIELGEVNHAEKKDAEVRKILDDLKIKLQILNSLKTRSIPKNTRISDGLGKDPESEGEELER